jgi:radical SAM superfamily enzyme YgiQ (UPF0313 family)
VHVEIIVVNKKRYARGHEVDFVPPITGIYLAALTPEKHTITVTHQQVSGINFQSPAEVIALTFFSGFAMEAYRIGDEFRRRGKIVIAGGPHVSYVQDESLRHFDSIILGEAEALWPTVLNDAENGQLKRKYIGTLSDLKNLPTPKYNLLPGKFFIRRVVQATRGCPFTCSFCSVPSFNPGFRKRPVTDVLRDIGYDDFPFWWQRKIVWFWDDNLLADKTYARELLTAMVPLKKWWLTQASIEIAADDDLLKLMKRSGCIGVFFGIETFSEAALKEANKKHNHIELYKKATAALHKHGIAVMAGLIAGFDSDTHNDIVGMADHLYRAGIDVPFISILTPYQGTSVYSKLKGENRILGDRSWNFYNGYNVAFNPKHMSPSGLLKAHRELWRKAFAVMQVSKRIFRSFAYLRAGAFLMSFFMNAFYGFKQATKNFPIEIEG